jgi:hypothetical protein
MLLLLACSGDPTDTADDTGAAPITDFVVSWSTDPSPAQAGQEVVFTEQIRDQLGRPIEDLVAAHERIVHTLLISQDLTSFQHLHMEDFTALSGEDLRESTFSFPVTLPLAGTYRLVFDYAWQNSYLSSNDWMTVEGAPAMSEPALDYTTEWDVRDLHVSIRWDVDPVVGYESIWTVTVTDLEGNDISDVVQYLGADAHAAVVSSDLEWTSHTHAWFPGMEDVAPGHDMPSLSHGPELPFHYTFAVPGPHKMWVQFAREGVEETYVVPFVFDVAP